MATVHLLTTADTSFDMYNRRDFERLCAAARCDSFRQHSLTDSPESADVILFVGSSYLDHRDVRRHHLVRRYRHKCFLYHSHDRVIPFLPGVYVNVTKRWHSSRRTLTGFYLRVFDLDFITFSPSFDACDYLFSFVGSARSHRVRRRLMSLAHPRAYLEDTSTVVEPAERNRPFYMREYNDQEHGHYGSIITRTKFVLCPRGYACSSWRLFETMKAGRVPVIISDQWVPPLGPAWDTFSIRVREKDIKRIPDLLEEHEPHVEPMGRLARATWEQWFSREAAFHRIVEWCLRLHGGHSAAGIAASLPYLQLLRPFFVRHVLLPEIKKSAVRHVNGLRRLVST
jgi:Exostosin family